MAMTCWLGASAWADDLSELAARNVGIRERLEAANDLYEKLFPYYFEACATSSFHPLKGDDGGSFGHGIMLIHGACRDTSNPNGPQQIRFCEENPNSTIGISTDAQFHNVNWTVVDSRTAILYGDHPADQPFNAETRLRLTEKSLNEGVYQNVVAKPWNQKEANEMGLTLNQWIAQFGFGTDYALTMARSVSCTRVPLSGTIRGRENGPLLQIIAYLNHLNQKAWQAANIGNHLGYQYEYMVDNCTHPTANALAQIGLVHKRNTSLPGPVSTSQKLKRQPDFAIPYNVMFETYKESIVRTRVEPIIRNLLEKPEALESFKISGWLGSQAGVILEEIPPHSYQNSFFHTTVSRSFFSFAKYVKEELNSLFTRWTGFKPLSTDDTLLAEYERELRNPEAVDISFNLQKWKKIYEELLKDPQLNNGREIETLLKEHLLTKLSQTKELLTRLETLSEYQNSNLRSK
jgi:hypothetical protein